MKDKLIEIIADVLKINAATVEEQIGNKSIWNSLLRIEILFIIEDEFDVTFSEKELALLDTPEKLIKATLEKVA